MSSKGIESELYQPSSNTGGVTPTGVEKTPDVGGNPGNFIHNI